MFPFCSPADEHPGAMRKALPLLLALSSFSTAIAEPWEFSINNKNFSGEFNGCKRIDSSTVSCTALLTQILTYEDRGVVYLNLKDSRLVNPSGQEFNASKIVIGSKQITDSNYLYEFPFYKELPVAATFTFKSYVSNSIARFYIGSGYVTNVPVQGVAAPTPTTGTVKLPSTQAFIGGKAYTVSFANCKLSSNGAYVCTSTVSPSR